MLRAKLSMFLCLCLALCAAPFVIGCGGCQSSQLAEEDKKKEEEERKKKEKEKPKPDFEFPAFRTLPTSASLPKEEKPPTPDGSVKPASTITSASVKPGHWFAAAQAVRANNFDFQAELEATVLDSSFNPIDLEHAPYHLTMLRPSSLPKGQLKEIEGLYFPPRRIRGQSDALQIQSRVTGRRGGGQLGMGNTALALMREHQFHLVVLARAPQAYGFLSFQTFVKTPGIQVSGKPEVQHYQVHLPSIDQRAPLPSHPLAWTSTAYLVWDDAQPNWFAPEQQTALLDWLHWGGQIIISGPVSLESLQGSFLADYLPAVAAGGRELRTADFTELNSIFGSHVKDTEKRYHPLEIIADKPLAGVALKPHAQSTALPHTNELVWERRVGRGRVVVTAFPIAARPLVNWHGYDDFWNACLMRRPRREFFNREDMSQRVGFKDYAAYSEDARFNSALRYFTRDAGFLDAQAQRDLVGAVAAAKNNANEIDSNLAFDPEFSPRPVELPTSDAADVEQHFGGFVRSPQSGVAGWNDFSGAAHAARSSLRSAAAISPPDAGLILVILLAYLAVLVPLNWLVFRTLGRVEWAWLAAPLIAILGAVVVVRMAQLDIGFERKRSEIAVLELQPGYARAHLTRYTALYTALSTTYDFQFDSDSALAMPFAVNPTFVRLRHQTSDRVRLVRDANVSVDGFKVASNTTALVHSEQMFDSGGPLALHTQGDRTTFSNGSSLNLRGAAVLRRTPSNGLQAAWLGDVKAGFSAPVGWRNITEDNTALPEWDRSPETRAGRPELGQLNLRPLLDLAREKLLLRPGEARLLAWMDEELAGATITPAAAQQQMQTLVVAHLNFAPWPAPQADFNDVTQVRVQDDVLDFSDQLPPLPNQPSGLPPTPNVK